MKATLTYNLPDDQAEFELATNASKWFSFAHALEQHLRSEWKYNEAAYTEEQYKVLEQIRGKFYELLDEEGLKLD